MPSTRAGRTGSAIAAAPECARDRLQHLSHKAGTPHSVPAATGLGGCGRVSERGRGFAPARPGRWARRSAQGLRHGQPRSRPPVEHKPGLGRRQAVGMAQDAAGAAVPLAAPRLPPRTAATPQARAGRGAAAQGRRADADRHKAPPDRRPAKDAAAAPGRGADRAGRAVRALRPPPKRPGRSGPAPRRDISRPAPHAPRHLAFALDRPRNRASVSCPASIDAAPDRAGAGEMAFAVWSPFAAAGWRVAGEQTPR